MLGELATRVLVLFLGYGYPAFECFKALEMREVEIRRLRFWLQYWTIVGIVTVFERFGDFVISWLPMYGEAKLAFFIYLWHPKTKGTIMVYEAFLRPLVVKHEPDIEERLRCFRARSADMLLFYIKNFTERGQSFFLDLLHYVISRSPGSSAREEIKRPESPGPPYPIAVRRSTLPCPTTEAGAYYDEADDIMGPTAEDPRRTRPHHKNPDRSEDPPDKPEAGVQGSPESPSAVAGRLDRRPGREEVGVRGQLHQRVLDPDVVGAGRGGEARRRRPGRRREDVSDARVPRRLPVAQLEVAAIRPPCVPDVEHRRAGDSPAPPEGGLPAAVGPQLAELEVFLGHRVDGYIVFQHCHQRENAKIEVFTSR